MPCQKLILILGDQLSMDSPALATCNKTQDRIAMIEARYESTRIPSHKARTVLFLSAMRHHAKWLRSCDYAVDYVAIDAPEAVSFTTALVSLIKQYQPAELLMLEAGEHGVQEEIAVVCEQQRLPLKIVADDHFYCSRTAFANWANNRRTLVMEHFYRWMRKEQQILMDGKEPTGGRWNFDTENRKGFGRKGPGMLPARSIFQADIITQKVLADVEAQFPHNPGSADNFCWPVTRNDALATLNDFVVTRLPLFGTYQDAMWDDAQTQDQFLLYHSGIAAALNLKLLNPREVIAAVLDAYAAGQAPLNAVEGFIRQILGWREYVRGIYWLEGPTYLELNALNAQAPLPGFYWTGDTEMACLRHVIQQTLRTGYAHHIQRLMVTGLFGLLLGVRPKEMHQWYLSMYIDAVEWVEAPNTLGMSQFADGGIMGSKPYVASGRYIQRMSNHCQHCAFQPDQSVGEKACPFTTLYWDFLMRHQEPFAKHPRSAMQWRMLERLQPQERQAIQSQADQLKQRLSS